PGLPPRAGAVPRRGREGAPRAFGCGQLDADADASAPSRRAPARAEWTWIRAGARGYRRERTGRPATRRRGAGDRPLSLSILAGVRLYNTLTRMVEDVVPVEPGHVKMYACGPTVYRYAHVGN